MKRKSDPRHLKRIKLMKSLFTWDFNPKKTPKDIKPIIENLERIDNAIKNSATDRPVSQINKVDLAILRLAAFELIIDKGNPPKVIIDEAVELGKEFGSDSSAGFVNGALGRLVELEGIKT